MAECFICKKQIPYYNGYIDGGCDHLKEGNVLSKEDYICKYIELCDDDMLDWIQEFDENHSKNCIPFIKEIIKRRNENNNN